MKELWGQGDRGLTNIYQRKIDKNSIIIELLGSLDEISAHIGNLMCFLEGFSQQKVQLTEILKDVFEISARIAESPKSNFDFRRIKLLENWILDLNKDLRPITKFIFPTGNKASCSANITRTIVRKTEVLFFKYLKENNQSSNDIGIYLNRLSDYMFVLTRCINDKYDLEDYYK